MLRSTIHPSETTDIWNIGEVSEWQVYSLVHDNPAVPHEIRSTWERDPLLVLLLFVITEQDIQSDNP